MVTEKILLLRFIKRLRQSLLASPLYWWWKWCKGMSAVLWYGHPSRDMIVIGITGTDGKTTTARLLHHLLQEQGYKTVFLGTTWVRFGDRVVDGVQKMTSYDPWDLQRLLRDARRDWCTHVVAEVSSHALVQQRFLGITFAGAAITNLSPEHLDYHGTMEAYDAAKQMLFEQVINGAERTLERWHRNPVLVFPRDEDVGRRWYWLFAQHAGDHKVMLAIVSRRHSSLAVLQTEVADSWLPDPTYVCLARCCEEFVDGSAYELTQSIDGVRTDHVTQWLSWFFNISNALTAVGLALGLWLEYEGILSALATARPEDWRQNMYVLDGVTYIIDFAHTPQWLDAVLSYMRRIVTGSTHAHSSTSIGTGTGTGSSGGRVWCLFGAPWERDPYKRPQMAQVVERYADWIIVTDDDAAGEDRLSIIEQICAWFAPWPRTHIQVIPDRKDAIRWLVRHVQPWDLVLLAGKGHERVLVTNHGTVPRSEYDVLVNALYSHGSMDENIT
jgi:UDP-N-acetylmuramoyl-L-alanyl-D-glutamate--2,6-diaminopimelate ligase